MGFIAKRELGRWIPSILLALRKLDSVLIDRGDAARAARDIEAFARMKHESKQVAAIFPDSWELGVAPVSFLASSLWNEHRAVLP